VRFGAWALDLDGSVIDLLTSSALRHNLQVHGGIGFTWEHDAHLYLRRAKSSQLLFGDARQHRSRLADLTGI
jgi:alkylation response protein AidB-like acyl-CoA dehydrogenase